ncbi:hypothetical protein A8924_1713 [Saccharopolyspora erythraea NRRL 2338]|uniref:Uncharacterized protein n=2 Tax=Saccharopolyspora erythraea TaxID=1836 RepID=A4F9B6_SACEN|nr:GTPase-associated protein 1-related protein [Saccharopolyspora erythraea]EQD86583.1 hypothetical protein N599_08970 [Saccharopolyspora erythraea D]PFG94429.1 hypothetical protein A8924_1713 [Saccharopolyspora erythraea NRRL 2338]QRK91190.1 hypothetical protein JQX30_07135 [Saccharopolyspora erythraea]CAM00641.1 hypothetical protein SACE_1318 [Saccharopolyspora erythraea NRRL 2338]
MGGPAFESLYYVDRGAADEGGFQAVSAGTREETKALVRRSVLHTASASESSGGAGPSLSHVFDGVYVTARGVRLAGDDKHRFTHAVATADSALYGAVRPAQLWDAPWWSEQPAPSAECAPVAAEPQPGPFGVEEVRDWVRGLPDGEARLLAVHSALDRLHGHGAAQVVFVGPDPAEIARWIAAATLLLPQEMALRVGFRIYATGPEPNGPEVLALRPDQAGRFAEPGSDRNHVVFDLTTGRHSAVDPTEAGLHWVPRFLKSDPYDVVDAVELAHLFARDANRRRATLADRLVGGVLMCGESIDDRAHALELVNWLEHAPASSTTDALERVTEAVMAAGPDRTLLRRLAISVHSGSDALAGQVRYALLWAEIDEFARGGDGTPLGTLPERQWTPDEMEKAASLVEAAAGGLDPQRLDPLLRLAATFGVKPRPERFADAAARFAAWWADNPGAGMDPDHWPCGDELIALLREELASRLEGPDAGPTATAIREHWWRVLAPAISDPFAPLDAAVAAAAVENGDRSRQDAIAAMLGPLREADRPGVGDAVWDALFAHSSPTLPEMRRLFAGMPTATLSESLAQKALSALAGREVSALYLDVLRLLVEHVRDETLLALWKEDGTLRRWLTAFRRSGATPPPTELSEVSKKVFAARGPAVVDALLEGEQAKAVDAVVRAGERLQQVVVSELAAAWDDEATTTERRDRAVVLAFLIGWADDLTPTMRAEFDKALEGWAGAHGQADYRRVSRLLRADGPENAAVWHEWLRELSKKTPRKPTSPVADWLLGRRRDR